MPKRIGVDLDGTLAFHTSWKGVEHIGDPVPAMLERVKGWIAEGHDVVIFTARVCHLYLPNATKEQREEALRAECYIQEWCQKHIGQPLTVTAVKDFAMSEIYDDRAWRVEANTGEIVQPTTREDLEANIRAMIAQAGNHPEQKLLERMGLIQELQQIQEAKGR